MDKTKQLEDLFLWKVSDELKLSSQDEKKFSEAFRKLNQQKQQLNRNHEDKLAVFLAATDEKSRKSALQDYKKAVYALAEFPVKEFDELSKILGPVNFAKFLGLRVELTNKVKSLMISPENIKSKKPSLPPPRLIDNQ